MKELEKDMDSKRIDQFYQSYRGIMRGFVNMIDMGNRGSGGSVEIKVSDEFKVEELFEELYEGKKKHFLFKTVHSKQENVAGKVLRDWNVVFDVSEISKLKSVKQETEAVDQGGPSKEFMNLVWRRLHKLEVTAKGNDGTQKSIELLEWCVYKDKKTGYLMPQIDDKIQAFLNSIPQSDHETARKKIDDYYRAIGKLFLHALVSHWHADDADLGSTLTIPSTALPPFYRQCEWNVYFISRIVCVNFYSPVRRPFRVTHSFSIHFSQIYSFLFLDLLRGCKPGDKEYPNHEVMRDINAIGFDMQVEHIIGYCDDDDPEPYTGETFFSRFLPKRYLESRGIALENIREGLTLEGYLPIPAILKTLPSKALDKIAFVDGGFDSAEDVIASFEPVYCREVLLPDEFGTLCLQAVESQVFESQKLFFEQTLPDLLREIDTAERADQEIYAMKVGKHEDFLSVCQALVFFFISSLLFIQCTCNAQRFSRFELHYLDVFLDFINLSSNSLINTFVTIHPSTQCFVHYATASPYLPAPELMEDKDKIKIEFSASEMTCESLPVAHTCPNILKFPHFAYDNNSETLRKNLELAFRLVRLGGAFGMQ